MNIWYLLETIAAMGPDRRAATDDTATLTYRDVVDRAAGWGRAFRRIERPGPIAFVGTNAVELVTVLFGAAWSGRAFLPLSFRASAEELRNLVERAAPAVVVAQERYREKLPSEPPVVDIAAPPDAGDGTQALADPDDAAVLLFTSGTTSAPKLVRLPHLSLSSYILNTAAPGSAAEDEAVLLSMPIYHVAGIANILSSVFRGRRIVLMPQFDAVPWLETASRERTTHAMIVPTMLSRLLDAIEEGRAPLPPTLRSLSYGGAPAAPVLIERAARVLGGQVDLINAFGLTETSSTVAVLGGDDHRRALAPDATEDERRRLASIGRPVPGVEIRIVRDDGTEAAPREEGEIRVRGPQLAAGYDDGQPLRLDEDGWLRTGDAGYRDEDGYIFISGRLDDLIIRGGENISPREVEEHLLLVDGVDEAIVFGLPDPEWGQVVGAMVVAAPGITPDEISRRLRTWLPGYKIPSEWWFADEIPKSEVGKPLRRKAREYAMRMRDDDGRESDR